MQELPENSTEQEVLVRIAEIRIDWEVRAYKYRWGEILKQNGTLYNTIYNTGALETDQAVKIIMSAS